MVGSAANVIPHASVSDAPALLLIVQQSLHTVPKASDLPLQGLQLP
jgi:hypothetical protein